jgi:signal transduction histidine kinase
MKPISSPFPLHHEHRVLALMILALHVVIWWDFGSGTSRSLMLAHLGLFLLWQPLWRREQRLNWRGMAVFAAITLAFVGALSWLLLGLWLLLLIGLVGGRVNATRTQRYACLLALLYLVLEFLVGWVPRMFAMDRPANEFMELFRFGLFAFPAVLLFIPGGSAPHSAEPRVDFLYGLAVSSLTLMVALGSLVRTLSAGTEYPVALIQAVTAIALFLLAVAWMWAPMAGFSGLGQLWERYVQNAGTPFERWLDELQRDARHSESPERFLSAALHQLSELPWVAGLEWRDETREGALGARTPHVVRGRSGTLIITLFTHRRMGTALMLHARLLVQLIGHFHRAKHSEREMARQAHLHAIYETGARMTHDIKNLLQALAAMTSAVEHAEGRDSEAASRMVRRQLPQITERLRLALDKLQAPQLREAAESALSAWWRGLTQRNADQGIVFAASLEHDPMVPTDLFDSVAQNLIENARLKRQREPGIRIDVAVVAEREGATLRVSDDGSPVAPQVRERLFESAVDSSDGLGIGLYQAAQHAREYGYRLRLLDTPGGVSFELSRGEGDAAAPASPALRAQGS